MNILLGSKLFNYKKVSHCQLYECEVWSMYIQVSNYVYSRSYEVIQRIQINVEFLCYAYHLE